MRLCQWAAITLPIRPTPSAPPRRSDAASRSVIRASTSGGQGISVSGSVTEIEASTGALVRVLSGSEYQFDYPDAMAVAGTDLFVANNSGGSVTELPM
jgi:hypothetical protein